MNSNTLFVDESTIALIKELRTGADFYENMNNPQNTHQILYMFLSNIHTFFARQCPTPDPSSTAARTVLSSSELVKELTLFSSYSEWKNLVLVNKAFNKATTALIWDELVVYTEPERILNFRFQESRRELPIQYLHFQLHHFKKICSHLDSFFDFRIPGFCWRMGSLSEVGWECSGLLPEEAFFWLEELLEVHQNSLKKFSLFAKETSIPLLDRYQFRKVFSSLSKLDHFVLEWNPKPSNSEMDSRVIDGRLDCLPSTVTSLVVICQHEGCLLKTEGLSKLNLAYLDLWNIEIHSSLVTDLLFAIQNAQRLVFRVQFPSLYGVRNLPNLQKALPMETLESLDIDVRVAIFQSFYILQELDTPVCRE
jgi:hypothetical protein